MKCCIPRWGIFQKIPEYCKGWCNTWSKIIHEYLDLKLFKFFFKSIVKYLTFFLKISVTDMGDSRGPLDLKMISQIFWSILLRKFLHTHNFVHFLIIICRPHFNFVTNTSQIHEGERGTGGNGQHFSWGFFSLVPL